MDNDCGPRWRCVKHLYQTWTFPAASSCNFLSSIHRSIICLFKHSQYHLLNNSINCSKEDIWWVESFLYKGRIHSKKEKVVNFHNWGGHPKMLTFSQLFFIFFACSNSSKSAIKFLCKGGRGTPWQIYSENLYDYQLNIDFFQSFFWFSSENFSYFAHNGFQVIK